ncbi:uncharacterized protein IWZ02DRAFT_144350 [Phyllosticta citriasiana]|uniref:uncharacterized protein n=1 Tax=Phyllosticta citriasiana TaxID=595635 RepID=UPI0030FDCF46
MAVSWSLASSPWIGCCESAGLDGLKKSMWSESGHGLVQDLHRGACFAKTPSPKTQWIARQRATGDSSSAHSMGSDLGRGRRCRCRCRCRTCPPQYLSNFAICRPPLHQSTHPTTSPPVRPSVTLAPQLDHQVPQRARPCRRTRRPNTSAEPGTAARTQQPFCAVGNPVIRESSRPPQQHQSPICDIGKPNCSKRRGQ